MPRGQFPHSTRVRKGGQISCRYPAQSAEWRRRRVEGRHQVPHQEQIRQQEGDQYDATKEDKQTGGKEFETVMVNRRSTAS